MDKIVSPVVPQPGAWKRPPRLVPTGARKNSRNRSISGSENELLSPSDNPTKLLLDSKYSTKNFIEIILNKYLTFSERSCRYPRCRTATVIKNGNIFRNR